MEGKQRRDDLNLADFKIDNILSVPGDQLLAEVAEVHGRPTHLADAFDAIASPLLSRHDAAAVRAGSAEAIISLAPAAPDAASPSRPWAAAWPRPSTGLATLAEWFATPLRRRVALAACAGLLLVAVLAPGIYRLVDQSTDRIAGPSADQIAPPSKGEPSAPLPGSAFEPILAQVQPPPSQAASPPSDLSSAVLPTAPPATPAPPASQPTEARRAPPPAAAASRAEAPRSMAAAEPPGAGAAPPAQAPLRSQATAKTLPNDGGGFAVQLGAARSEAQARAAFRNLRSKYAVLQGREPVVRRKEASNGVSYAVEVGPFESKEEADALCRQLKAGGGSCFTTKN
jgi:cell division septation protein DedD